jgi:hypothetical protein
MPAFASSSPEDRTVHVLSQPEIEWADDMQEFSS